METENKKLDDLDKTLEESPKKTTKDLLEEVADKIEDLSETGEVKKASPSRYTEDKEDIENDDVKKEIKEEDEKPEDMKPEDVKTADVKPEDVKPEDVKTEDVKTEDVKPVLNGDVHQEEDEKTDEEETGSKKLKKGDRIEGEIMKIKKEGKVEEEETKKVGCTEMKEDDEKYDEKYDGNVTCNSQSTEGMPSASDLAETEEDTADESKCSWCTYYYISTMYNKYQVFILFYLSISN